MPKKRPCKKRERLSKIDRGNETSRTEISPLFAARQRGGRIALVAAGIIIICTSRGAHTHALPYWIWIFMRVRRWIIGM